MGLVSTGQIKSIVNKYLYDSSITKSATYKSIVKIFNKSTAETEETITSISTKAMPIKYTKAEIKNSAGSIQEGDKLFLIREKDFLDNSVIPKVGDRITIDSKDWEITDFELIEVDDQELMYEFHCRL